MRIILSLCQRIVRLPNSSRRASTDAVEGIIAEMEAAERERQHIPRADGAAGRRGDDRRRH